MKTQTVFALGILAALGLGAYWLYTKSQAKTNTTGVSIPIGSGGVTATIPTTALAGGVASLASGLVSDLGGLFSGGSGTQTVATPVATPVISTGDSSSFSTGTWDDFSDM